MMRFQQIFVLIWFNIIPSLYAFPISSTTTRRSVPILQQHHVLQPLSLASTTTTDDIGTTSTTILKEELLALLGGNGKEMIDDDSDDDDNGEIETLFADPITKEALMKRVIPSKRLIVGGGSTTTATMSTRRQQAYEYSTTSTRATSSFMDQKMKYVGSSDTYINLLEPYKEDDMAVSSSLSSIQDVIIRIVVPFIPIPLRSTFTSQSSSSTSSQYIPMRDLFTSPTVSYLYERGWRQGFSQAGFPGVDTESIMAYDYLRPALLGGNGDGVLVDMSCATGLFTRKFFQRALRNNNNEPKIIRRLIGADYSDAMLREARQRIENDQTIQELLYNATTMQPKDVPTTLELVRLDVGKIPMLNDSVDALHAGAAMHCWPEIDLALTEIYRVLRPNGGRYFATTFLSNYFRNTQQVLSLSQQQQRQQIQQQTFQYFESVNEIRTLLMKAGFQSNQIQIDVVGRSCVIIRCEK